MRNFYAKTMLTALLSLCSTVVSAQSFESNGISYSILSLSDKTVEVAYNANYQGFIIIPSTTDYSGISFKVTGIGDGAFKGTKVTEMIISEGVTYIGDAAFYASTLKEIIIPDCVTSIGSSAFDGCNGLASITIPDSVTSIGEYAFRDCTNLTSITIPNNVTSIGDYAFNGCTGLTSVTIPDSVTTIGDYAFNNCTGLTSVTIGNSVTTIGDLAFYNCTGLTSVTIGNSVTSIGQEAFRNCAGLICVTIGNSVTSIGSGAFYGCTKLKLVCDCSPLFISAGSQDFGGVAYYANIVTSGEISHTILTDNYIFSTIDGVPTLVAYIGSDSQISLPLEYNGNNYVIAQSAFRNCTGLTRITIPNSVTSIGSGAFYGCTGLTSVTIGNSVITIVDYTFYNCAGLTSITIPNSVTSIGGSAFYGCSGLKSIKVGSGNTKYDSRDNCNAIIETATNTLIQGCKNTIIPNSVTTIGVNAFRDCTGLTSITIPNSVTTIGGSAFYGCTGLTSITIPNSVTSIGAIAFKKCTGLTSVTIGSSVTSIGQDAFYNCTRLTEVHINDLSAWCKITFPNNVSNPLYYAKKLYLNGQLLTDLVIPSDITEIKDYAFYLCTGLTSITIPNSITTIGKDAFDGCTGLICVTIGNSVTSIGSSAFSGCTGLTEMYVKATTPPTIYSGAFYNVPKTIPVYVPTGTKAAYQAADYWKDFFNIVEMTITGDVDGDNIVDIADVTTLAEIILNGEETEEVPTEQTFDAWTSTNSGISNSTSQNSYTLEATEGIVLTFDWSVSSENNYDWLIITLDGTQILKKSGNDSGSYTHTFTTAGTHTLVVKYTKDGSRNSGSDKGKIYNIKLSGSANNKSNPAADVNSDGSVDVGDITSLVDIILGTTEE